MKKVIKCCEWLVLILYVLYFVNTAISAALPLENTTNLAIEQNALAGYISTFFLGAFALGGGFFFTSVIQIIVFNINHGEVGRLACLIPLVILEIIKIATTAMFFGIEFLHIPVANGFNGVTDTFTNTRIIIFFVSIVADLVFIVLVLIGKHKKMQSN